jgi:peptide-methionine (S)-S-oxide reductase
MSFSGLEPERHGVDVRPQRSRWRYAAIFLALAFSSPAIAACRAAGADTPGFVPDPTVDESLAESREMATAVVAGGCFWGVEAVFRHVKGVTSATSGYAGGSASTAHYEVVSTGRTGHAESVRIVYDRSQITYGRLLKVFLSVAHDPTEVNRQGPDEGTQYRSAVFTANAEQKRIAEAYIAQLGRAKVFRRSIATEVVGLREFYEAEDYHQDYVTHHPDSRYVMTFDLPKVNHLHQRFPELYRP